MGYLFSSCNNADSAIPICRSIRYRKNTKHSSNKVRDVAEIREFSYAELDTATNGFSTDMFLGKGSHGRVYRAVLDNGKLLAAVKKTKVSKRRASTVIMSPAENEIEILSKVRNNPGLVNLIGFCVDSDGEKLIVVEYMPNGTLHDLLHKSSKLRLSWRKRLKLALNIANAIDLLHSSNPPVIHRDIKSSNVLLDGKMRARLGDFGLALRGYVEDVRLKCTPPAGTLGYLDPSYLAPGDLSTKSDVFSFGILLLEIISGRNAIDVEYSPPSIIDWAIPLAKSGNFAAICDPRISLPAEMKSSVARQLIVLASRCVAVHSERRPEMGEVIKCLKKIKKRGGVVTASSWSSRFTRCVRKPEHGCSGSGSGGGQQLVASDIVVNNEDEEQETVVKDLKAGGRRGNRRVSSLEFTSKTTGPRDQEGMSRSRSIGSVVDRKRQDSSVKVRVVRLSKSRSMGMLHIRNSVRFRDQSNGEEREFLITDQQTKTENV